MNLRERLEEVETRIQKAVLRCGRKREEITLVAVTKTFPAEVILQAYELGVRHFGENYVQEFEAKFSEVSQLSDAVFHMIGHLQSNKARRAAELSDVIQTVDSEKLARRLNQYAEVSLPVMIEVKLSEEQTKAGIAPENLTRLVEFIREQCPQLRLVGLMTMPPYFEDPERSRPYFRKLRQLAEAHQLDCLSMGMSHDFEVAIEEGATHIRVGTALFGPRTRK